LLPKIGLKYSSQPLFCSPHVLVTASHFSKLIGLLNFPDSQPPPTTSPIKGVLSCVQWILGLLDPEGWIDGMSQESVNNSPTNYV